MLKTLTCSIFLCVSSASATEPEIPLNEKPLHYNITLQVEWIQLPSGMLKKLIIKEKDVGTKLRRAVQKKVKAKKATIIDSVMNTSVSRSDDNLTSSSLQFIYPTDCEPSPQLLPYELVKHQRFFDKFPYLSKQENTPLEYLSTDYRNGHEMWTTFEEQSLGSRLEFRPVLNYNKTKVDIHLDARRSRFSHLYLFKDHKDQWGNAKIQLPQIARSKTQTCLSLRNNSYQFISQSNALHQDGSVDPTKTIAVFARVIIRPISK